MKILGKGEGNSLMVWPQMPPASEWKMVSRPMKTDDDGKHGRTSSGRRITRSIATPTRNEPRATSCSATQKGIPNCSSCQAM